MRGFDPFKAFGTEVAETYDDFPRGDEAETVDFMHALAGSGPVLELAIGTGRIGLPLAARGVRVDGVEISEAMVARLRSKPGGDGLAITIGDFAEVPVEGRYRLIYVVFNTFFNLLTQDDQVRCFQNVAAHLTDDGHFVIEAETPAWLYRLRNHQYVDAEMVEADVVRLRSRPLRPRGPRSSMRTILPLTRDGVRLSSDRHRGTPGQRARPDGAHRRAPSGRPLGRLEKRAVHRRQPPPYLGVRPLDLKQVRWLVSPRLCWANRIPEHVQSKAEHFGNRGHVIVGPVGIVVLAWRSHCRKIASPKEHVIDAHLALFVRREGHMDAVCHVIEEIPRINEPITIN